MFWKTCTLAPLTTLKVGGPARYFTEPKSAAEVAKASTLRARGDLPLFVLGGGSNLVISDAGWPGLVLKLAISGIDERNGDENGKTLFEVGAGEEWDRFVARAVARNCAGIECLSGIPGSVGGTPFKMSEPMARKSRKPSTPSSFSILKTDRFANSAPKPADSSIAPASSTPANADVSSSCASPMRLTPGGKPRIEYADLKKHFAGFQQTPSLTSTREAVRRIRAAKAMLITPGDEDCRSAGSFFKNPVLCAGSI